MFLLDFFSSLTCKMIVFIIVYISPDLQMLSYKQIKKIGHGQFGDVYLVQKLKNPTNSEQQPSSNNLYAMKTISSQKIIIDVEADILQSLNHPNAIKVYEIIRKSKQTILILEYADQGDLQSYLKRYHNYQQHQKINSLVLIDKRDQQGEHVKMVKEEQVLKWLVEICLVLHYLHTELRIIHRDIKSNNILLMENGLIKLSDFGIARKLAKNEQFAGTSVGTPCYLSPEIINLGKYDQKTDIWGLGCVMFEICTGNKPFYGKTLKELIKNITDNDCGQISEDFYSKGTVSIIKSMLEKNPEKRPSVEEILDRKQLREAFERVKTQFPQEYKNFHYPIPPSIKTSKYEERDFYLGTKALKNMEPLSLKEFYTLKTAKNRESSLSNHLGKIDSIDQNNRNMEASILSNSGKSSAKSKKVEWSRFANRSLSQLIAQNKKEKSERSQMVDNFSFAPNHDK